MHALDNVIWQALTTRQSGFAESFDGARKFPREVTSLGAFLEPSDKAYESLWGLLGTTGVAALFLDEPYEAHPGFSLVGAAPLLQMVCDGEISPMPRIDAALSLLELGAQDSPEMVELTALTKPGPFGTRTHELGHYLGIRSEGKLVAMAGERLKVPGFTEVSAVCTHPEHAGKGYARTLMMEVMQRIRERGETPLLHVRKDNTGAIGLYRKLGFQERVTVYLAVLRRG